MTVPCHVVFYRILLRSARSGENGCRSSAGKNSLSLTPVIIYRDGFNAGLVLRAIMQEFELTGLINKPRMGLDLSFVNNRLLTNQNEIMRRAAGSD